MIAMTTKSSMSVNPNRGEYGRGSLPVIDRLLMMTSQVIDCHTRRTPAGAGSSTPVAPTSNSRGQNVLRLGKTRNREKISQW